MDRQRHLARWAARSTVLIVALVGVGLAGKSVYKSFRWKRFAVVEPGRIYRSGQLAPDQLRSAIATLRLRTVICLNPLVAAEEAKICAEEGATMFAFDMPSSGLGAPADFDVVVEILTDPARQPVLVHCSAGVARTGASVALYRVKDQGWTVEAALAELRSFEGRGRLEPALRDHVQRMAACAGPDSTR